MKLVYEAANTIEAHMVLNMLEQEGIAGRIDGEFLQGGIGDLPTGGFIRVMVEEENFVRGRALVESWDAAQPRSETAPAAAAVASGANVLPFIAGLVLGLLCAYFYLRSPVNTQGFDHDGNGKRDEVWYFTSSGTLSKMEADRNFDDRIDFVMDYDAVGAVAKMESDDDFDGTFETALSYRRGSPGVQATDTDHDSFADMKINYTHGVIASVEHIYPSSGLPRKIDYFKLGKMTYSDIDADLDGKMEKRVRYGDIGEIQATEQIAQ